jgi:hypothetical protein
MNPEPQGRRSEHLPGRAGRIAGSGEGAHARGRRDRGRPPAAPHGRGGWRDTAHWRTWAVTLLDAFEGRRMLIAYYFMWHAGHPAPEQCEGCTFYTSQVRELSLFIPVTSPMPRSARARTKRAPGTATSWAGRCLGTRPPGLARHSPGWTPGGHDAHRLLPATGIQMSSRLTGRRGAASRRWTTATGCST